MAYAKGNAPAVTERDPGGPLRDHGDRDGVRRKPARTDPESREAWKGRREVGGDGGHGARRGRGTESRRPSGSGPRARVWGNGSGFFCHFAAVICNHKMFSSSTLWREWDGCDAYLKSKMPIAKFYFLNNSIFFAFSPHTRTIIILQTHSSIQTTQEHNWWEKRSDEESADFDWEKKHELTMYSTPTTFQIWLQR
jgi:hypothetical protein